MKDPEFFDQYRERMTEFLDLGYARNIPSEALAPGPRSWYIPHHATGGKFRIVFDCGATYQGTSLNNDMLPGPDQTSRLVGVLLRFRSGPVAVMADVKVLFHQVKVYPEDIDSLRFLWWPDKDLSIEPEEFQMLVHLFWATSPSICRYYALRKTAVDNVTGACSEVLEIASRNLYVGDMLKSFSNEAKAKESIRQLVELLHSGGYHLTKFASNRSVLQNVPLADRCEETTVLRALGLPWDVGSDSLLFQLTVKKKEFTRRGVLSMTSQIFDPLGFLQPFLLPAKIFLKKLSTSGIGWDDRILDEDKAAFERWLAGFPALNSIHISRCFIPPKFMEGTFQLHCFTDASFSGYGAVVFLRVQYYDDIL